MIQQLLQLFAPCYEDNLTQKMSLYIGVDGLSEQGLPWETAHLIRCDFVFVARLVNSLTRKGVKKVSLFWA